MSMVVCAWPQWHVRHPFCVWLNKIRNGKLKWNHFALSKRLASKCQNYSCRGHARSTSCSWTKNVVIVAVIFFRFGLLFSLRAAYWCDVLLAAAENSHSSNYWVAIHYYCAKLKFPFTWSHEYTVLIFHVLANIWSWWFENTVQYTQQNQIQISWVNTLINLHEFKQYTMNFSVNCIAIGKHLIIQSIVIRFCMPVIC